MGLLVAIKKPQHQFALSRENIMDPVSRSHQRRCCRCNDDERKEFRRLPTEESMVWLSKTFDVFPCTWGIRRGRRWVLSQQIIKVQKICSGLEVLFQQLINS